MSDNKIEINKFGSQSAVTVSPPDDNESKKEIFNKGTVSQAGGFITFNPPVDDGISVEPAKKIITQDEQGIDNGHLIELFKDKGKTTVYLTSVSPGTFKGYHLHNIRAANYVCVKGCVKIIMYPALEEKVRKEEVMLDSSNPQRLHIPAEVATGLECIGSDSAWIINYPEPAYDPAQINEQIEFTLEQLEKGEHLRE